jgi:hypothetical protein
MEIKVQYKNTGVLEKTYYLKCLYLSKIVRYNCSLHTTNTDF